MAVAVANGGDDTIDLNGASFIEDENILANDGGGDRAVITVNGTKGTATINPDYTISYVADEGQTGSDTITYVTSDGTDSTEQTVTFTNIDSLTENVAPTVEDYYHDANDDAATLTTADIPWATIIDAVAEDLNFDDDNTNLVVELVGDAPDGFTLDNSSTPRTLTWTRDSGTDTSVQFSFKIVDDEGLESDTATFTITDIGAETDTAPVATDDAISLGGDSSGTLDVLDNDTDVDDYDEELFEITSISNPLQGTAEIAEDGKSIVYTANEGATGMDTITYTLTDSEGTTDTATVTITDIGEATNDDPVANDDTLDLGNGLTNSVDVLGNDTDTDVEDTISILSYTDGEIGTVSVNEDGELVYTVNDGEYGTDEFTYTITDGSGGTDTATVAVSNISDIPETAPEAVDDYISVEGEDVSAGGTPEVIAFATLLGNDTDANSDVLDITFAFQATYGSVAIDTNADTITYTAIATGTDENGDPVYAEDDSFEYLISDGNGGTSTATVYLSDIDNETENAPVGVDDEASVAGLDEVEIDVLANDTDADNEDDLVLGTYTQGSKGTVSDDGTVITYTPDADATGTDTFLYQVVDGDGLIDTATVTITGIGDPATITDGVGTEANDIMEGATGEDSLDGGAGDDEMNARGGNDTVRGDEGDDDMRGGNGDDNVYGGDGNDLMRGGNGNDKVRGNLGDDRIYGNNGNDKIYGGAGEDSLMGGSDNDKMWGGEDADTFMFKGTADDGMNRVHDFELGSDMLQIGNDLGMGDLTMKDKSYGVKITWADGDAGVRLDDVTVADLSSSDFLFA